MATTETRLRLLGRLFLLLVVQIDVQSAFTTCRAPRHSHRTRRIRCAPHMGEQGEELLSILSRKNREVRPSETSAAVPHVMTTQVDQLQESQSDQYSPLQVKSHVGAPGWRSDSQFRRCGFRT